MGCVRTLLLGIYSISTDCSSESFENLAFKKMLIKQKKIFNAGCIVMLFYTQVLCFCLVLLFPV